MLTADTGTFEAADFVSATRYRSLKLIPWFRVYRKMPFSLFGVLFSLERNLDDPSLKAFKAMDFPS
jgi:uncharacterized lipoprotein YddW (UPF0748 family)